ncbi:hypothetical protein LDL08_36980 [Nonomuraea glycinis]|uniref:MFS transporter n=1 Tax=Nonomuraea glycinis TaxID=2047744 RepID=A0A918ABX3_9ACTN|nr:hypothetical protein [Nonomuraea glycinis]MCA2181773.1 hypothetical protein [Nonomuraea glycinis]GGP14753.1 MFS transporter [Nonomuraea glycinis]
MLFLAGGVTRQLAIVAEASLLVMTMLTVLGSASAEFGLAHLAAYLLPILFVLPLGVLVDRVRRGTALTVIGWLAAGLLTSLAMAVWLDAVTLPHVVLVATGVGMLRLSGELAQDAYLPAAVGRDRFVPVNAVLLVVGGLSSFGIVIQFYGSPRAIAVAAGVAALGFAASAWLFGLVHAPEEPAPPRTGVWREAVEGVRFTLTHPVLRAIVVCLFGLTAMQGPIEEFAVTPLLAEEGGEVTRPEAGLSWSVSLATPIGAVLAMLLYRRVGTFRLAWAAVLVSQPFALLVLAGMDWGPIWYVLGRLVPWAGAAVAAVTLLSHRQAITPSRLLGRSGATLIIALVVAEVAGSLLEVLAESLLGQQGPGDAGGWPVVVLATAAVLACAVPMFRLRRLSHPAEAGPPSDAGTS